MTVPTASRRVIDEEREHEDRWYERAVATGFFHRPGFARLIAWNLDALRRAVELKPHWQVLSIGSGLGHYEVAIAREVAQVVGFDLSSVAVTEARRAAGAAGLANVEFVASAVEDFERPGAQFDLVYAMGVLHHVPSASSRVAILRKARGWLREGGTLYVREPSRRGLPRRIGYRLARASSDLHSPNEDHLDPDAMAAEVREAGFRDVRVDYTDVLMGPLPWVVGSLPGAAWGVVAAFDRAWLATPGLRRLASQFAVIARR
jgi:2-polyprenyl-3-methyl-5-hydroxy-6-metoxy-1,4-benzoquinol methylase